MPPKRSGNKAANAAGAAKRHTNCSLCRHKRVRCDSVYTWPAPCSVCAAKGTPCDGESLRAERTANDKSELTAEVQRMQGLIEELGASRGGDSGQRIDVDLVGAFTRLCFSDQPALPNVAASAPLLDETMAWLAREVDQRASTSRVTIEDLCMSKEHIIATLPTPAEAEHIVEAAMAFSLNRIHGNSQAFTVICLGPDVYLELLSRYNAPRADIERLSLSELAMLHAFAAWLAGARYGECEDEDLPDHWKAPDEPDPYFDRVLQHLRAAERALELGDYLEQPDISALHALWMISMVQVYNAPTTLISRGIAGAATALSLAKQMGLHREDIERDETPLAQHNRRGIVAGLCEFSWHISQWLARVATTGDDLLDFPVPEWLPDSAFPPDVQRAESPSQREYEVWHARHRLLALDHKLSYHLSGPADSDALEELLQLNQQAKEIEETLPESWRRRVKPDGSIGSGLPADADTKELLLAMLFNNQMQMHNMAANRLFLLSPPGLLSVSELVKRRADLILNARLMIQDWLWLAQAGQRCSGAIAGGLQSFLVAALGCALDLDVPGQQLLRSEAQQAVDMLEAQRGPSGFLPSAMRRALSTLKFLLSRPVVSAAQEGLHASKRQKQGALFQSGGVVPIGDIDHFEPVRKASQAMLRVATETETDSSSVSSGSFSEEGIRGESTETETSLGDAIFDFVPPDYLVSFVQQ